MCQQFSLHSNQEKLSKALRVSASRLLGLKARYKIRPGEPVMAFTQNKSGLVPDYFNWGLLPSWAKDPNTSPKPVNARAETLTEKPSFRDSFKYHRCLIPADGFYEWKTRGTEKIPYFIHLRNQEPFTFAGLWAEWNSPDGSQIKSCAIITCAANAAVKGIHPRMPVIIGEKDRLAWTDSLCQKPDQLKEILCPYADREMSAYAAQPRLDQLSAQDPACLAPLEQLLV